MVQNGFASKNGSSGWDFFTFDGEQREILPRSDPSYEALRQACNLLMSSKKEGYIAGSSRKFRPFVNQEGVKTLVIDFTLVSVRLTINTNPNSSVDINLKLVSHFEKVE